MAEPKYRIVFQGEIAPGQDPAQVKQRIAALLKMDGTAVQRLFSGQPMIKRGLNQQQAARYRDAFARAGAVLKVVPDEPGAAAPAGQPAPSQVQTAPRPAPPPPAPAASASAPAAARAAPRPAPPPFAPAPSPAPRPAPVAPLMTCPKCGVEQPESDDCGACGVVISKYRALQEEAPPEDDYYYDSAPLPPQPAGGAVSSVPTLEQPKRKANMVAVGCGGLVVAVNVLTFLLMRHPYFRVMAVIAIVTGIGWIVKGMKGGVPE